MGKFGWKRSKLSILTGNWHTEYLEDADSYSVISFLNFLPKIFFFGQIWVEKVKLVCFAWKSAYGISRGRWFLLWHYFCEFPTLNPFLGKFGLGKSKLLVCLKINTYGISRILIPILMLVFSNFKSKSRVCWFLFWD